jgi:hypothetical protein
MSTRPLPPTDRDYALALRRLKSARVPVLIGGAWAVEHYVALGRATLDLDLMLQASDLIDATAALTEAGGSIVGGSEIRTRVKVGGADLDLVHHFARGELAVDQGWFDRSRIGRLFGLPVRFAAPEDLIWSKLFIAARHRFDGSDVVHLLRATSATLDWNRLKVALAEYPELLLGYLSLFAYCYPADEGVIPRTLLNDLLATLERNVEPTMPKVCRGSLIDHASFDFDYLARGLVEPEVAKTIPSDV